MYYYNLIVGVIHYYLVLYSLSLSLILLFKYFKYFNSISIL